MKEKNRFGELDVPSQMPMENLPMSGRIEKKAKSARSPMEGTPKKMNIADGKDCLGESPKKKGK
jgi:hypothetical protein